MKVTFAQSVINVKKQNVTFTIGSTALIDKADGQTDFFRTLFGGIGGRAKDFIPSIKLLMVRK